MSPEITLTLLSALNVGLVQVIKQTQFIDNNKRWMPIVSLVTGSILAVATGFSPIQGLMIGLAASGLYDVGRGVGHES